MHVNDTYEYYIGIVKNDNPFISVDNHNLDEYEDAIEQEILVKNKYHYIYTSSIYIPSCYLTPSELEGMSEIDEKKIRFYCSTIIQETGIILKLPQTTILTGMNIFNHFYWKKTFVDYEPFHIACASLFLATKTEETFRKMRDVISCSYYILKKKEISPRETATALPDYDRLVLDISSNKYVKLKGNIIQAEAHILKELGFSLYEFTNHSHKYLLHFVKNLKGTRALVQRSWNFLNDIYRTSLCVNYPPNVLACSAIFLAARIYYFVLPNSLPWWEAFETLIEEIQEVCAEILRINEVEHTILSEVRDLLLNYSIYKNEIKDLEKTNNKDKYRRKEKYYERINSRSRSKRRSQSVSHSRSRSRKKYKNKKNKYNRRDKRRKNNYRKSNSRSYSRSYSSSSRSSYSRSNCYNKNFSRKKYK